MTYSRFFMPLNQDAKGYDFKGRMPAGRCIIEERGDGGKLSVWAQDLKPETAYGVWLVFAHQHEYVGLPMGALDVDPRGKAEFKREICPDSLHNFTLSKVAAVAVLVKDAPGVASPLCGYRGAQVDWQRRFRVWEKEAENEAPTEAPTESEPPECPPLESPLPEAPPEIPPETPSAETPPTPPRATKPKGLTAAIAEGPKAPEAEPCVAHLVAAIFDANAPCQPFDLPGHPIKWARCHLAEQMPLPSALPHLMNEPFMQAAWADHEHFLLGIGEDGAQYVIGIPGKSTPTLDATAKSLGFTAFASATPDSNDGYWLMFIDF
ncbi:MAG: hypothetical protein FWG38_11990 [Defluviitaleaceae bacterium]|nr:hypothetical protein [Defluviitaleaceae bacterium]